MVPARTELENLNARSGEAKLLFDSAAETLQRLEGEITALRESLQARRAEENGLRAHSNQLRSE